MDIIEERKKTHGDFSKVAMLAQRMKQALREGPAWHGCSAEQREALELIATKLARIVCGNPQEEDHWRDIGGYAALGTPPEHKVATLAECVSADREWVRERAAEQDALNAAALTGVRYIALPPAGTTIAFDPRAPHPDPQPWQGKRGDVEVRGATWDDVREALERL